MSTENVKGSSPSSLVPMQGSAASRQPANPAASFRADVNVAPGSVTIPIPEAPPRQPDLPLSDARDRPLHFKALPPGPDPPPHLVTGLMMYSYDVVADEIFARWPGFPLPFSTPCPPVHKIAPVKDFGLAMIATANIARGQTIHRERPLLLYPKAIPGADVEDACGNLARVVDSLRPENREAVYALRNVKGPEWPSHLKGILDTNSLALPDGMPGYRGQYSGLAREISRINHSCMPNATVDWDLATLSFIVRATWPIRAGEQVTIGYIDLGYSRAHRQRELSRRYKFTCKCKACAPGDEARIPYSDLRRAILIRSAVERELDDAAFEEWIASGAPVGGVVGFDGGYYKQILQQMATMDGFSRAQLTYSFMEEEGYFRVSLWEAVLVRLVKGYSVLQDETAVRKYAITAALLKQADTGSDGGWWDVARNPTKTEWWGKLGPRQVRADKVR